MSAAARTIKEAVRKQKNGREREKAGIRKGKRETEGERARVGAGKTGREAVMTLENKRERSLQRGL